MVSIWAGRVAVVLCVFMTGMFITSSAASSVGEAKSELKWRHTVLDDTKHFYVCDLVVGAEYLYALGWVYPTSSSLLFRSPDEGKTWLAPLTVSTGDYPGQCVYNDGNGDILLVAGLPGKVQKSVDSGATWIPLSMLPQSSGVWITLAIGTNASWFGGPVDDDIYVVGGLGYGSYQTAMTISHDGGLSWTNPVIVAPTYYQNGWCEVISDGTRLYVFYTLFGSDPEYGKLCVRASCDWGATWSEQKIIAESYNTGPGVMLVPLSLQFISPDNAFVTLGDSTYVGAENDSLGRWGFFNFADMTYTEIGTADWSTAEFAGKLLPSGRLVVLYETYAGGNIFPLMFAATKKSILK